MKCKKCNKPIKEDTDGNLKYCQGHSIFEKTGEPKEYIGGSFYYKKLTKRG